MTTSRASQVDYSVTSYYHCISRCVRGAFLYGKDENTGRDYSHRKSLIIERIKRLAGIFSIYISAYAIMDNHYHLVLYVDTDLAKSWSEGEVKRRWSMLFPADAEEFEGLIQCGLSANDISMQIEKWRSRLMDLSWFMAGVNEYMARRCNLEDKCKGRFWQGRFKIQALLDQGAVLSAMAYVDLNPVRAKMANTPEESDFTSISERINELRKYKKWQTKEETAQKKFCENIPQPLSLMPFAQPNNASSKKPVINFNLLDYLELVDNTGRILRGNKRGVIPEGCEPILIRLNLCPSGWLEIVSNLEKAFSQLVGEALLMSSFAKKHRRGTPRGITSSKRCYRMGFT